MVARKKQTTNHLSELSNVCAQSNARILVLSLRNIKLHVSQVYHYEFEDVIGAIDTVDIFAPVDARMGLKNDLPRRVLRKVQASVGRIKPAFHNVLIDKEYELFFFICRSPVDLVCLQALRHWREQCRTAVCWLDEIWVESLENSRSYLELLKEFDDVFITFLDSVHVMTTTLQQTCHYLPVGIDALQFCPYPFEPSRHIDVYSIGRRSPVIHRALLDVVKRENFFYVYDTVDNFSISNYREHRALYANMLKRSRYFLVNKAKFNALHETGSQEEVGARFFEGVAGGAVLLGKPPESASYRNNFDWPDAVIAVPDEAKITELIADLNAQPERLARIRTENMVHALLRHDWVYRWETILATVGLPTTPAMLARQAALKQLAARVTQPSNQRAIPVAFSYP